jgi:hypothetical protein
MSRVDLDAVEPSAFGTRCGLRELADDNVNVGCSENFELGLRSTGKGRQFLWKKGFRKITLERFRHGGCPQRMPPLSRIGCNQSPVMKLDGDLSPVGMNGVSESS